MDDVRVLTEQSYWVRVRDSLDDFAETAALAMGEKVAIVSDDNVDALYGDLVAGYFAHKEVLRVVIPHGEAHKSPREYVDVLNRLAEASFTRCDTVVALGGGVVGDLAGFVAATYMRGIRLIAVPTSLLAMVDSSVGGKTAINIDYGKNLCGAFYQPAEVYINTAFLASLPPREWQCGWGEIIKYAFLAEDITLSDIEGDVTPSLISKCVRCKADIVSADEREGGLRKLLNLGHTIGHAVERLSDFALSHGAAVAIGLAAVLDISKAYYRVFSEEAYAAASAILAAKGHDLALPFAVSDIMDVLRRDKKSNAAGVSMVLIAPDLKARVEEMTYAEIEALLPARVRVAPHPLTGTVAAPPSKSYAHRYLLAAYLAGKPCLVRHVGDSEDVSATLGALSALGLMYERVGEDVRVLGVRRPASAEVYCRESGSTLRFLLPVAAALGIRATFTGAPGLMARPIADLVDCLNLHGADIDPDTLTVRGKLRAGDYEIEGRVSSQYVTGLLFALPLLEGDSRIRLKGGLVSRAYVDITLDVLRLSGVSVSETAGGFLVQGVSRYDLPEQVVTPGDWSAAAFMLVAGALGQPVSVSRLDGDSKQGDRGILDILRAFGAHVRPAGDVVTVSHGTLTASQVDVDAMPDLAQIVAVLAAYARGTTTLRGVGRLRLKESDRLAAIMAMLGEAGIACTHVSDDLVIEGGTPHGALFEGGNDHRTVMSACVLAAYATGESRVTTPHAVAKSYPDFFKDFISLGGMVDGDI